MIVVIRDMTDSINFEKLQLEEKEVKVGQVLVGMELVKVFTEHAVAIDASIYFKAGQDNACPCLPVFKSLKHTESKLMTTMHQFKDLGAIRLGDFVPNKEKFNPKAFFDDWSTAHSRYNLPATLTFEI